MGAINRAAVGKGRSSVENMGGGAAGAMLLVSFIPESWNLNAYQLALAGVVATSLVAWVASVLRDKGFPGFGGVAKVGLVLAILVALTGCVSFQGTITPKEFTSAAGETVIACEVKGNVLAVGDGGICRVDQDGYVGTVEGGHASETFKSIMDGLWNGVGRIVGGLFGGVGAAFSAIGQGGSGA